HNHIIALKTARMDFFCLKWGKIEHTFRTPRMASHLFSRGHFSHAQHHPTVVCCHRMRGDTPNAFASGAWYGARATAHRSVPGPTSAHCEGLCRQDWFGRDDQSVGTDGDGDRSRDHCAGHGARYLEWPKSPLSLGRVLALW